jgi:hypothetical protein
LQTLAESGYGSLTFSFIATTHKNGYRDAGYYTLDLAKVKTDPTLTIRNADGYINHDVFTNYGMKANGHDNAYMTKWITIEYALSDLIACYDQLFKGEEYWTLAIPYGSTGYRNAEGEVVGNFYISKLSFNKITDDYANVLSSANDWAVMLSGGGCARGSILDYNADYATLADVPYEWFKGAAIKDESGTITGYHDSYQVNAKQFTYAKNYRLEGQAENNLTHKNKSVAFSFPTYANSNQLPIFIGAGLSHVTKMDLQTLLSLGYTKLTFSFVHTSFANGARNAGYYLLDLEKVKADSTITLRRTETGEALIPGRTDGMTYNYYKNSVNLDAFTLHTNTANNQANNWVTVNYEIADILACYDQLFAGETYWTLAIPYGTIGNNKNAEREECGRCYVSNMAFTK